MGHNELLASAVAAGLKVTNSGLRSRPGVRSTLQAKVPSRERGAHLWTGQPPWQAAEVPLGADVGSRAQQHHEAQLVRDAQEALNIGEARVAVLSWQRLVQIPWHVHLGNTGVFVWKSGSAWGLAVQ